MEELDMQLIERYLANELTPEERSQLESRSQADPSFWKELQAYQSTIELLKVSDRQSLKNRLKNRELMRNKDARIFPLNRTRNWVLAAAATLLVGLLGWKFLFTAFSGGSPDGYASNDQLYAEYFTPFKQDMSQPLEKGDDTLTALDQFNVDYWNSRYDLAVAGFPSIDSLYRQNDNLHFRYANALIAVNQLEEARHILDTIISNRQSKYVTEAKWYLAMIAIKKGDIPLARSHLDAYRDSPDALRKKDAIQLLKRLPG